MSWELRFSDRVPRIALFRVAPEPLPPGPALPLARGELRARDPAGDQQPPEPPGPLRQLRRELLRSQVRPETKRAQEEAILRRLRDEGVESCAGALHASADARVRGAYPTGSSTSTTRSCPLRGCAALRQAYERGVKVIGATPTTSRRRSTRPIIDQEVVRSATGTPRGPREEGARHGEGVLARAVTCT